MMIMKSLYFPSFPLLQECYDWSPKSSRRERETVRYYFLSMNHNQVVVCIIRNISCGFDYLKMEFDGILIAKSRSSSSERTKMKEGKKGPRKKLRREKERETRGGGRERREVKKNGFDVRIDA